MIDDNNKEEQRSGSSPSAEGEQRGRTGPSGSDHADQIFPVLFAIADAVNTTEDLDELYQRLHRILGTIIDVTNFFIALVDSRERTLHFPYHVDTVDNVFPVIKNFETGTSLTGLVVEERSPLLLQQEALQKRAAQNGIRGPLPLVWMGSPLLIRDKVIGVVAVQSYTDADMYSEADLQILVAVSQQIALAIERKAMAKALQEKSEELERYFTLSLDLLCIADTGGHFLRLNPEWQKVLGYPENELQGRNFLELVHPDDMEATLAALTKLDAQQDVLNFTNRYRCRDGGYRWIEWHSRPQGKRIYAVARDISERMRAEEELRQSETTFRNIVQASPMGIHIYHLQKDDRLVFIGCNPAADELLKVDNTKFIGLTLEEAFPPLTKTEIPVRYRRAAALGESWKTEQVDYQHGSIAGAFEVCVFQMSQDKAAVLFNDITERKRSEEERTKLQLQLTQAQKMESVGRLAGGVAHDFNNMLGVILGHTELALRSLEPNQPLFASLQEIGKAARRSADLTRQLLAFARKQTVAPKVLDLNETVDGMLTMLRRLIGEDINLAWLPGRHLGAVHMDPSQLDQILANLCVNARDAIVDTGRITIETAAVIFDEAYCRAHSGFSPGEYVLLAVSDNGCGMDAETQCHLFEPFFTTKEMGKGTGLGLATIYGIVKQNNGFINIYSEPGAGTTVKIYLPRYGVTAVPSTVKEALVPTPVGRESILLVEDEPMILEMTRSMLELQGYKVLAAGSPGEALRLAREYVGQIDLLMTDVVMPEMNGRDLAKNLLSLYPSLKRLFMSGYTANVIAHHGVLDEGVHFIQKPFSINDLAGKVREVLDKEH